MDTELCKDDTLEEDKDIEINNNKYLNPGTGEFLYPTDIVITQNPFIEDEQLMMITDMGNNRVSIFKKYDKKQFRFSDFK